ncbi:cytochrome c oxidase subunit II [Caryophanon tenue]|uniref:Cytochrome c oxidase subunit 2 n=1 Tax=Caryophanon tenue TaxID=33978 RepID=A0A1C0YKF2_9BACL|nr:cytochrome c oxidase subunit II [Caryophanon tenue]OCS87559.1 cytochrome c oxidase subunit II [Caryophanon tenue]
MMKGLKKWRLFGLLATLTVFLSACGEEYLSTLTPAGKVGEQQFNLLILSTAIMAFVIIVVCAIYLISFFKFRRSVVGENVIPKQVEGSHTLEVIWTVIPVILLLILAVPTVTATYKLGDTSGMDAVDENGDKQALTVNVTAKLYWWEFEYPDLGIVTAQELVVPTGENVYFNLIAADVKHSFWIPAVGGKMDTNVENLNKFYLEFGEESADLQEGVFYGKCAELCGPSHALMDFKVKTLARDDFDTWVSAMQNTADRPVATDVQAGEQAFVDNACISCHATDATAVTPDNPYASNAVGPNLATFGDRSRVAGILEHTEEEVVNWLKHSDDIKPGNLMPVYEDVPEEELEAIAAYLMSLSVEE